MIRLFPSTNICARAAQMDLIATSSADSDAGVFALSGGHNELYDRLCEGQAAC